MARRGLGRWLCLPGIPVRGDGSSWHLGALELLGEPPSAGRVGMGTDRWDARFWANFFSPLPDEEGGKKQNK